MIPAVAALVGRVAGGAAAKAGAGKVGQSVASYAGRTAAFKMGSSNMTTSPSEPAIQPSREASYQSEYIDTGR
jgi:hypothetical protein